VSRENQLLRADGWPPHLDRFERAGYDLADVLGGSRRGARRAAAS
jgi:pilus assembly protein CpaF